MTATVTLTELIDHVEHAAASDAPLDLLAAASAAAAELTERSDQLLSHFVDRCRHAGHSWAEIGAALGVTKQAVQKRFTGGTREPRGWDRFTADAKELVTDHAAAVAGDLGHNYIGTEHLLLAVFRQPDSVPARALANLKVEEDKVVKAVTARVAPGHQGLGGFTPRAWVAVENAAGMATSMGDEAVGPEHVLLSLLNGVGGIAEDVLAAKRVTRKRLAAEVTRVRADD